jgi:hypothetical protein
MAALSGYMVSEEVGPNTFSDGRQSDGLLTVAFIVCYFPAIVVTGFQITVLQDKLFDVVDRETSVANSNDLLVDISGICVFGKGDLMKGTAENGYMSILFSPMNRQCVRRPVAFSLLLCEHFQPVLGDKSFVGMCSSRMYFRG